MELLMFILLIAFIVHYMNNFSDWLTLSKIDRLSKVYAENSFNNHLNNIRQALEGSGIELLENASSGEFDYVDGKKIEIEYLWALKGAGYFKGFFDIDEIDKELYRLDKAGKIGKNKKVQENPKTEPGVFFEDIQE